MHKLFSFLPLALCACGPGTSEAAAPPPPPQVVPLVSTPPQYTAPLDCGRAYLAWVAQKASGRGERHPAIVALREKLATCPAPLVPSTERCVDVAIERARARELYGPAHPKWRELDAETEACKDAPPPPPPDPASCNELQRRRDALVSEGKGERHPLVVAVDAELGRCARAPSR